jgi:hypothetical protein
VRAYLTYIVVLGHKQEPAEATMRNCHGSAVGILAINGEEDVNQALLVAPCEAPLREIE